MTIRTRIKLFSTLVGFVCIFMLFSYQIVKADYTGPGNRTIQTGFDNLRKVCYLSLQTTLGDEWTGLTRYVAWGANCPAVHGPTYTFYPGPAYMGCVTWDDYKYVGGWDAMACRPYDHWINIWTGYCWFCNGVWTLTAPSYEEECTLGSEHCTAVPHYETFRLYRGNRRLYRSG